MCAWRTCYSGSNNILFNTPPIMSDGRNFASWQPDAVINKRIQQTNQITSNWNYRQYMQSHGQQIMNYNTDESFYELGLTPHLTTDATPSSNVPYLFKGTFDTSSPGFGYCNSDLKNPYLTREQLNARMISPSIHLNK